ncbi:MAG: hypothetical protein GY812_08520 [Actinomycetia bacterium]|nr:hypothetical protein [Actinomycetes bacterium]
MIPILVILGLAVVWAIVLFPDVFRWVSNNRRGDTIRSFNNQLSSLRHSSPVGRGDNVIDLRDRMVATARPAGSVTGSAGRGPAGADSRPRPASPAMRKRRQDVLVALGSAALLTLLATLAFGSAFLYLHLLVDALLVGYLVLLQRVVALGQPVRRPRERTKPSAGSMGQLAPLSGPMGRTHTVEPRRIAN